MNKSRSVDYQNYEQRENVKVVIRIRPPLDRERDPDGEFLSISQVQDDKVIYLSEYLGVYTSNSDRMYDI